MIITLGWVKDSNHIQSTSILNSHPTTALYGTWVTGNSRNEEVQIICVSDRTLTTEDLRLGKSLLNEFRYSETAIYTPKKESTGLGDLISNALSTVGISEERVSQWLGSPCNCGERKEKLNQLSNWALRIIKGKTEKASEYLSSILECITESIPQKIESQITFAPTLNWAYGITTVPSRRDELFPRTLESLRLAGFNAPRLFIDQCTPSEAVNLYGDYGLPISSRDQIRTAGHWVLSMYELYIRNPAAERFAIFQDDFVTVKNLRRYLERAVYPEKGYLNLYTFPSNQSLANNRIGWYESNQLGRGAVALVFSREAVLKLLGHPYLAERFQDTHRGYKAIDGGIVETMKRADFKEYVHNPSLTQHTGLESSMGNPKHQLAISFPGENFDSLELLK